MNHGALRPLSPYKAAGLMNVTNRQTHRQTDHATPSAALGRTAANVA